MKYTDIISADETRNVCIDFDGVIHNNYDGFGDGTIYGNLIDGAKDAIQDLSKKYNIIIFTAKAKQDRPLVNGKTGTELVWEWLEMHGLDEHISEVTAEKPRALVYIDDKALRFVDWNTTLTEFKQLYDTE